MSTAKRFCSDTPLASKQEEFLCKCDFAQTWFLNYNDVQLWLHLFSSLKNNPLLIPQNQLRVS